MAEWPQDPSWSNPETINNGEQYAPSEGLTNTDMNKIVQAILWLKLNKGSTSSGTGGSTVTEIQTLNPDFIEGKYVTLNGDKVVMYDNDSFAYAKIPVLAGEVYYISNRHNYYAYSYILANSSNKVVRTDNAGNDGVNMVSETITIQDGEAFMYINKDDAFEYLKKEVEVASAGSAVSPLNGKKIVYDGDSICYGAGYVGGYAKLIADKVGGFYENQGIGGGRLRTQAGSSDTFHSIVDNIVNLPTDGDLYCFEGGMNDYWTKGVLGTFDYTNFDGELDTTTVCGALETIFRYALNNFVGKPICFIITHKMQKTAYKENSNGDTFKDYHDAMIGICEKYSIPYYDAFSKSGLNGWNTVQDNAFLTGNSAGTPDGSHPTEGGYKRYYVPQLISLFEAIMPDLAAQPKWVALDVDFTKHAGYYAYPEAIGSKPKIQPEDGDEYSYAVINVSAGEKYLIDGEHAWFSAAWFTTNSSNLVTRKDSASNDAATSVNEEITIQNGETQLYINKLGFNSIQKWMEY